MVDQVRQGLAENWEGIIRGSCRDDGSMVIFHCADDFWSDNSILSDSYPMTLPSSRQNTIRLDSLK